MAFSKEVKESSLGRDYSRYFLYYPVEPCVLHSCVSFSTTHIFVVLTLFHLQLLVQSLSQPEPERELQPQQQQQLLESNLEHQVKPVWIKHQRLLLFLLGFSLCSAILGLIYYMHHNLHTESNNNATPGRPSEKCDSMTHCMWNFAFLLNSSLTLSRSDSVYLSSLSVGRSPSVHVH